MASRRLDGRPGPKLPPLFVSSAARRAARSPAPRSSTALTPRRAEEGIVMMRCAKRRTSWALGGAVLLAGLLARPAAAQLQWASPDGKMSLKLGLLSQLQLESLDDAAAKHSGNNIFFRRLRLLGGFQLSPKLSVFIETDTPNLGKGNADGTKN